MSTRSQKLGVKTTKRYTSHPPGSITKKKRTSIGEDVEKNEGQA